jgi:hypothetical protein
MVRIVGVKCGERLGVVRVEEWEELGWSVEEREEGGWWELSSVVELGGDGDGEVGRLVVCGCCGEIVRFVGDSVWERIGRVEK